MNTLTNADDEILAAYVRKIEALEDLVSAKDRLINSQKDLLQAKDQRIKVLEYCLDRYERMLHNVVLH